MSEINDRKVKLFSLNANIELAKEISTSSGIPLSLVDVKKFADGEISMNISESVRGHDVFVVQPTSTPVNEHLMELFIFCDACKRASAKTINVVMPYYGYSRQDRKAKSRQPITAKLVADFLETCGVGRVICVDLHAAQIQGFFNIPIDNLLAGPILADYFKKKNLENVIVVSPDHGGVTRARKFAERISNDLAIIDKVRPEDNKAEVMNIIGQVSGKTAIIVDDIIDTAGTICAAAEALIENGAIEVYVAATHAIFSRDAVEKVTQSVIKEMVVTNTIYKESLCNCKKITRISIGNLISNAIIRILKDEPISPLFDEVIS
ncbi:MAG: ribose-phosphate pyrophosphokinase [Acholeplasmatales bacterium]|nr:ribose-phosphate pyrophosphokinase [Acholeplasmatales bacterium]